MRHESLPSSASTPLRASLKYLCSVILLTLLNSSVALSDCTPSFTKVSNNGFGDAENIYMHSMDTFAGFLYVGTLNRNTGAEIWRYDGSFWEQIVSGGLGNSNVESVRNFISFGGEFYAGIYNEIDGAELWKTSNGTNWVRLTVPFSNPDNMSVRGFTVFNGYLYVGLQRADTTAQLWRTPDGNTWEPVILDGLGNPNNSSAHFMKEFGGYIYVGVRNIADGAQLWRSQDGVNFEIVVGPGGSLPSGFGYGDGAVFAMDVYKGHLYLGTTNWYRGFGVYRSANGTDFTKVAAGGFGDNSNAYAWRFEQFEDALWLGVMNRKAGEKAARLWRSFDGNSWTEMVGPTSPYASEGFGNLNNWGVRTLDQYKGKLYIGTAQCWHTSCEANNDGAEIWMWSGEVCTQP